VPHAVTFAVLGATGVILSAVYLLWMLQRVLFGEITRKENAELTDLNFREEVALVPLAVMALIMGLVPMGFLRPTQATINALRDDLAGSKAATVWRITK
jgi:NADH-quinone oxidoreductase subunit M